MFIAIGLLLTCITAGVHLRVKANIEREWIPKSLMHLNDQAYWVKTWEHKQESMIEEFPIDETIIIVRDENILTEQSIKQVTLCYFYTILFDSIMQYCSTYLYFH